MQKIAYRFLDTGWDGAKAWTMEQVWASLPRDDRHRVEKLEFLDEQELLQQLFQHYCVSVAWRDSGDSSLGLADIELLASD
jgi:[phosphatase 2A protein]-leucine-carboxy methyltransferase